jgi:hypothetical protein
VISELGSGIWQWGLSVLVVSGSCQWQSGVARTALVVDVVGVVEEPDELGPALAQPYIEPERPRALGEVAGSA